MLLSDANVLTLLEFLFVCHQLFKIFNQKALLYYGDIALGVQK